MRSSYTETLEPASEAEAIDAFGDGEGVTVLAGGTILMPEVTYGRYPRGGRTLMLHRAGLSGIRGDGPVTIGAMTPLAEVAARGIEPLASAAAAVADAEIRNQATFGGNLCAPPGRESPRGDLQTPLLVMKATVRSAGAGGERTEPVEDYLAADESRLVLSVEVSPPDGAAYVTQRRPHSHSYSVISVAAATYDGVLRLAAGGVGSSAVRLRAVEAALADGQPAEKAAGRAAHETRPQDDALASAWYRREILPVLIARVLQQVEEAQSWN
ncbi:MAG TPA: FAD binding domain-containing protein [Solirubrobacteraceae bacterium]|nr:FAD binding domain-containing protein [Solirubrobacteraceae bacterium]